MADTPSASSEGPLDLRLPTSLRSALAIPWGPVLSSEAARSRLAHGTVRLATCGDVVTEDALSWGFPPFLAVIDGKTLRGPPRSNPLAATHPWKVRRTVANPPGTLSASLREAIHEMANGEGGLLWVDGEEDLATIPLILELPEPATVIYGQPGAGVCFVPVDVAAKDRARKILTQMEVIPSHGHQGR